MTLKAHRGRCAHCGHDHDAARKMAEYRATAPPAEKLSEVATQEPHYLWSHPREAPRVCRPTDANFAAGDPDWVRQYPVDLWGSPAPVATQVASGEATTFGLDYDGTITRDPDMWFAVMKTMQAHGHEVHIVTMRHGVESLMGGAPMEQRFLDGADGVHFTGNATTGDRDAKRPHMEAKGIEVHVWIDDNPKAVHMSAREIWGWCTQPGDPMLHSAPEVATPPTTQGAQALAVAALQKARAHIVWLAFGECRSPGWDGAPPSALEAVAAIDAALAQAPGKAQALPVGREPT